MVFRLIPICRIEWCYSLFFLFEWKYRFWENLFQKIKILILSWNLLATLIRTCRIQWCFWFRQFLTGNNVFGQICSKKSKLSLYPEIWYLDSLEYLEFNDAIPFFCFWVELPFYDKFGPQKQNCHFMLKFGTYNNSQNI